MPGGGCEVRTGDCRGRRWRCCARLTRSCESFTIWMLPVPASEIVAGAVRPGRWKAWRAVEGQHVVSTLRLAGGDPARQDLLERILEESKPPLPEGTEGLHYLLATPFRYPPSGAGSRFRGVGRSRGVVWCGAAADGMRGGGLLAVAVCGRERGADGVAGGGADGVPVWSRGPGRGSGTGANG
jgi:hypothetical protein